MKRVLVTGSSRGIGLEFVRQLAARGDMLFATCRTPDAAHDLHALSATYPSRLHIVQLDVDDPASLQACYVAISHEVNALDWLVNNAGVNGRTIQGGKRRDAYESFGSLDPEAVLQIFRTNTVGPLLVAQRFTDLLRASDEPRILNISTQMASLTNKSYGGSYGYSTSKTALNMVTRLMGHDLGRLGIVSVAINPGWVVSDMGGAGAPLPAEESVAGMLALAEHLTPADAGRYLRWDGEPMPW